LGRILLLDDYLPAMLHIRGLLRHCGYICDDAESTNEALALLHLHEYDAALLDLITPYDEPVSLVMRKCQERGIRFAVVTVMLKATAERCCPTGTPILEKPFGIVELEEILGGLIGG